MTTGSKALRRDTLTTFDKYHPNSEKGNRHDDL